MLLIYVLMVLVEELGASEEIACQDQAAEGQWRAG